MKLQEMGKEIIPVDQIARRICQLRGENVQFLKCQFGISKPGRGGRRRSERFVFTEQGIPMLSSMLNSEPSGERTRLSCWRWGPCHRELFLRPTTHVFAVYSPEGFSAKRRKGHARRVRSAA
jgi:hypothetical protein